MKAKSKCRSFEFVWLAAASQTSLRMTGWGLWSSHAGSENESVAPSGRKDEGPRSAVLAEGEAVAHQPQRFFGCSHCAFELRIFDRAQHFAKLRSGRVSGGDQLMARD
jgi:hypothetical protein